MKRFLNPFTLIVTSVISAIYLYLGWRLAPNWLSWTLLGIPFLLAWSLPVVHWSSDSDRFSRMELGLQRISYLSMGIVSWLLVLTVSRDFLLVVIRVIGPQRFPSDVPTVLSPSLAVILAILMSVLSVWKAQRGPLLKEVKVLIPELPESLAGLRLAQISDLHVGPTIGRKYVEAVVRMVESARPDLTLLTGDIVDGNLSDFREAASPMSRLKPEGRVYYSPGNHEYYWELGRWLPELKRLGMKTLLNEGTRLDHDGARIWIGGITDPAAGTQGLGGPPDAARAAQGGESCDFRILLSHRPDFADAAERSGFDLQLSGHTHGGQFFPWTIVAGWVHRYLLGLHVQGRLRIYVSPGTGTWGPPLRMGTTPEVTLLTLSRA